MAGPFSDAQRAFALGRLSRGKLTAADLRKKLSGAEARRSGFDEAGDIADQLLSQLIEEGLVKHHGGPSRGEGPRHPRPRASYELTAQGSERARQASRPSRPDHSEELLLNQKAFILLQFFRAEERDQSLTRSELGARLRTKTAVESLAFDAPTIDFALFALAEEGHLDERRKGGGVVYRLTDDGVLFLANTPQYGPGRFTLKGSQLNALIAAIREKAVHDPGRPDDGPTHVGRPVPSSIASKVEAHVAGPMTPILDGDSMLDVIEKLRQGDFEGAELIPIHEVRRRVAERFGQGAASHGTFDSVIRGLRRDDRVRMIAISDLRDATREQLNASIEGENETLFYLVSAHEPAHS